MRVFITGATGFIGSTMSNRPAAHRIDTARLYRLALEKAEPGDKFHAVAEEGILTRDITEVIGHGLDLPVRSITPEEDTQHFGWLAVFAGWDMPASSLHTRKKLGWNPTGPDLITDLMNMRYSAALGK